MKTYTEFFSALKESREPLDESKKKITAGWIQDNIIGADAVKNRADGITRVARGFFYSHGSTNQSHANKISAALTGHGIKHDVTDSGTDDYKAFRGGASIWKQNHHWVDVKIHPGQHVVTEGIESLEEAIVHLKRHPDGLKYHVMKDVGPKHDPHMKAGEVLNDTEVDDLHDMGFKTKIHEENGTITEWTHPDVAAHAEKEGLGAAPGDNLKRKRQADIDDSLDAHRTKALKHLENIKKMITSPSYNGKNMTWGHVGSMDAIAKHLADTHDYKGKGFGSSDDSGRDPRDPARNNGRDPRQPVRYQPPKHHPADRD